MSDFPPDSNRTLSKLYMELKEGQIQLKSDVDYIKKDVTEIKDSIKDFHTSFADFKKELKEDNEKFFIGVDKALSDKANLWVEWFCKTVIGGAAVAAIGLFIFIIEKLMGK